MSNTIYSTNTLLHFFVSKLGKHLLDHITDILLGRPGRVQGSQLLHDLAHVLGAGGALHLDHAADLGLDLLRGHGLGQVDLEHLGLLILLVGHVLAASAGKGQGGLLALLDRLLDQLLDHRVGHLGGRLGGLFEIGEIAQDALFGGKRERVSGGSIWLDLRGADLI